MILITRKNLTAYWKGSFVFEISSILFFGGRGGTPTTHNTIMLYIGEGRIEWGEHYVLRLSMGLLKCRKLNRSLLFAD